MRRFQFVFDRYQEVINRHKTSDLSDSQPTKGNIAGGLTTIEEKALGNIQKIGRKCVVDGVLDKAETPTGPGLWFMDSSSAAAEMVTLVAAAGYVVHFFPTGQGNVIGNPILPVIKLCANPRTVRTCRSTSTSTFRTSAKEMTPTSLGRAARLISYGIWTSHCGGALGTRIRTTDFTSPECFVWKAAPGIRAFEVPRTRVRRPDVVP